MHPLQRACLALAGLWVSAVAVAQPAPPGSPPPAPTTTPSPQRQQEIRQLISDLSSPDEPTRDAAMRKLVSMGDDAQQALQEHIRSRDAAQAALRQIESNRVAGPTLVSLDVKDASVREVIEELSRQSGYAIRPYHDNIFEQADLPTITLAAKDQPFWQVMREVMSRGEVAIYESGRNDRVLLLMPQRNMGDMLAGAPCSHSGAFMFVATNIQRNHSVNLAHPQNVSRNMSIQLQVYCEPKVKILRYTYQPEIDEAVDDKGNSLRNAQNGGGYASGRQSVWSISVPLTYPQNPGERIAKLKGTLRMSVQTRSETLEVTDLASFKPLSRTVGGRRVQIASFRKTGNNQVHAKLIVHRDGMDQQVLVDLANNPQAVQLLDKDGKPWRYAGGGSSTTGDRLEMDIQFHNNAGGEEDNPGEPARLVWEVPTAVQEIAIPFEFDNLPLP
jgi:hypothetical protein